MVQAKSFPEMIFQVLFDQIPDFISLVIKI